MTKPDFPVVLDEFITGLESEQKADNKKFYNESHGAARVRNALAILDAARVRLQQFYTGK
jgi:hypothetical protein